MMKLKYTKPASEAIALQVEGMIAASGESLKISDEKEGNQSLTNRHGWNADNWSGTADEDAE